VLSTEMGVIWNFQRYLACDHLFIYHLFEIGSVYIVQSIKILVDCLVVIEIVRRSNNSN